MLAGHKNPPAGLAEFNIRLSLGRRVGGGRPGVGNRRLRILLWRAFSYWASDAINGERSEETPEVVAEWSSRCK